MIDGSKLDKISDAFLFYACLLLKLYKN